MKGGSGKPEVWRGGSEWFACRKVGANDRVCPEETPLETMVGFASLDPMTRSPISIPGSFVFTAAVFLASAANAAPVPVPNGSFEMPSTGFVSPMVDIWQKTPAPVWFDPALTGGVEWGQLSGVFANTAVGSSSHIENLDGTQALYVFALPGAGLTQVLGSSFEVGMAYELSVALVGGGGGMPEGTVFQFGLFYMDGLTPVSVGSTTVLHSAAAFPTSALVVDYSLSVPTVGGSDSWAGQAIGIQVVSASGAGVGYWNVDNVRLSASVIPEPGTYALLGIGAGSLLLMGFANRRHSGKDTTVL